MGTFPLAVPKYNFYTKKLIYRDSDSLHPLLLFLLNSRDHLHYAASRNNWLIVLFFGCNFFDKGWPCFLFFGCKHVTGLYIDLQVWAWSGETRGRKGDRERLHHCHSLCGGRHHPSLALHVHPHCPECCDYFCGRHSHCSLHLRLCQGPLHWQPALPQRHPDGHYRRLGICCGIWNR